MDPYCQVEDFGVNNNNWVTSYESDNGGENGHSPKGGYDHTCQDNYRDVGEVSSNPDNMVVFAELEGEKVQHENSFDQQDNLSSISQLLDITSSKPIRLIKKIRIPAAEYPKVNFMGRLLGPQGKNLKAFQTQLGCRLAILGKGSIRDKVKEQQLLESGDPKYSHLSDELHLSISILAPTMEAYARLYRVMEAVLPLLKPEPDNKITITDQTSSYRSYESPSLQQPSYSGMTRASPSFRGYSRGRGTSFPPARGSPRGRGYEIPVAQPRGRTPFRGNDYRFKPY